MDTAPFCVEFSLKVEKPPDPRTLKAPESFGEHLLHCRIRKGLLQKDMATLLGCNAQTYQLWECNKSEPSAHYFPKIIKAIGYLPDEDLSTYYGVLRSQRLRRGLDRAKISKLAGANQAAWTRWERGIYVPAFDFMEKLKKIGIDLTPFGLHGDIVPTPLAKALRKARKERGLSHKKMSLAVGFKSVASWHRYEIYGVVPVEQIWPQIYDLLGIQVADFVSEDTFPKE